MLESGFFGDAIGRNLHQQCSDLARQAVGGNFTQSYDILDLAPRKFRGVGSRSMSLDTAVGLSAEEKGVRARALSFGSVTPNWSMGKFLNPRARAGEPSFTR